MFEPNIDDANLFQSVVEHYPFAQILANTNEIQQLSDLAKRLIGSSYQASKLSFTRKEVSNKVIKDELLKLAEELFRGSL